MQPLGFSWILKNIANSEKLAKWNQNDRVTVIGCHQNDWGNPAVRHKYNVKDTQQ